MAALAVVQVARIREVVHVHAVAEAADLVGHARCAARMDPVDHALEVDGFIVRAEHVHAVRRRIGGLRHRHALARIRRVRVVAHRAHFRLVGAVVAVHRQDVVALVATLDRDGIAPRLSFGIRHRRVGDGVGYRDALDGAVDVHGRMAVDRHGQRARDLGRHRDR